jgi:hypothetical protein
LSTIAATSQVFCTSSSRCDDSHTVRPSSTSERISPRSSRNARRIQAVDRLVEHEQLRVARQAAGDPEPLAHPQRVGLDAVVAAPAEADTGERPFDAPVGGAIARGGVDVEVLAAGEVAVETRLLDDRADARERSGAAVGRVVAEQAHASARGLGEAEQQADERRLVGPLGPRKPKARPRGTCRSMD